MADVVRPSHGLAFQDLARRVYFSRSFSYFYASMILLNIAILIWAIQLEKVNHSDSGFIALEVVAVLMLLAEILLRVVHQRRSFWKRRWWAVVDIGVALLSALSIFFFIGGPSAAEEVENLLATAVRALRYTAQGLRVLLLLKARHARTRQGDGDISFTALTRSDSTEDVEGGAAGGAGVGGGGRVGIVGGGVELGLELGDMDLDPDMDMNVDVDMDLGLEPGGIGGGEGRIQLTLPNSPHNRSMEYSMEYVDEMDSLDLGGGIGGIGGIAGIGGIGGIGGLGSGYDDGGSEGRYGAYRDSAYSEEVIQEVAFTLDDEGVDGGLVFAPS